MILGALDELVLFEQAMAPFHLCYVLAWRRSTLLRRESEL